MLLQPRLCVGSPNGYPPSTGSGTSHPMCMRGWEMYCINGPQFTTLRTFTRTISTAVSYAGQNVREGTCQSRPAPFVADSWDWLCLFYSANVKLIWLLTQYPKHHRTSICPPWLIHKPRHNRMSCSKASWNMAVYCCLNQVHYAHWAGFEMTSVRWSFGCNSHVSHKKQCRANESPWQPPSR